MIREHPPAAGSTHRSRAHCRLQGTPADLCVPPTPGAPAIPGRTGDPQSAPSDGAGRSLLPAVRGVAERGRRLLCPGSPPLLPEPGHRRIPKVASRSSALPLPFLPLRVGAHLPTPSARKLSGHPCGSLSSSSRYSAAPGSGGGGSAGGRVDGVGTRGRGALNHLF